MQHASHNQCAEWKTLGRTCERETYTSKKTRRAEWRLRAEWKTLGRTCERGTYTSKKTRRAEWKCARNGKSLEGHVRERLTQAKKHVARNGSARGMENPWKDM
jgi:hypothetical protein